MPQMLVSRPLQTYDTGPNASLDVTQPGELANLKGHQVRICQALMPSVGTVWEIWEAVTTEAPELESSRHLELLGRLDGFGGSGFALNKYRLITDRSHGDSHICWGSGPRQNLAVEQGCFRKDSDFDVHNLSHDQVHKFWGLRDLEKLRKAWTPGTFGEKTWNRMPAATDRRPALRDVGHLRCETDKLIVAAYFDTPPTRKNGRAQRIESF